MDYQTIDALRFIQLSLNSFHLSAILLVFCYGSMLFLWHFWQKRGLYLYSVLAIIIANIQVLKNATIPNSTEMVALGTIMFATTFTASDILTENYGAKEARTCVSLCFISQILLTLFLLITIAFPSLGDINGRYNGDIINPVQYAMVILFVPSVRIVAASLVSYYISQIVDINVYSFMKNFTQKRMMWLRFNVSAFVSGLVDNVVFSLLAWVILAPEPISFHSLVFTYILGTYLSRVVVAILSTPVIYLSTLSVKKNA